MRRYKTRVYKSLAKTKSQRKHVKKTKTKKQDAFVHEESVQYKSQGLYSKKESSKEVAKKKKDIIRHKHRNILKITNNLPSGGNSTGLGSKHAVFGGNFYGKPQQMV